MDKDKQQKAREKKVQDTFNSGSKSTKPHNQNQEHNVRKESVTRQDYD